MTALNKESLVNPPDDPFWTTTIGGVRERCHAFIGIWHGMHWLAKENPDLLVKDLLIEVARVFGP